MKDEHNNFKIGDSAFWVFVILINLIGMTYLSIWSYHNDSLQGALLSFLFFAMIVSSILLSRFKVFDMGTWGENSFSFTAGMFIWMGFAYFFGQGRGLSVAENQLYATIAGDLPEVLNFVMNVIVVPISEELFWMVGLPFGILTIMFIFGKNYPILNNPWVQIFVISVVGGITFAVFHVANLILPFLISAFIFRSALTVFVWGDKLTNFIKPAKIIVSFAVGAHIGNNMMAYGIGNSIMRIQENFMTIGWLVAVFFGVIFLSAINYFIVTYVLRTNKVSLSA